MAVASKVLAEKPKKPFRTTPETNALAERYRASITTGRLYGDVAALGHSGKHIASDQVKTLNDMLGRSLDVERPEPKVWNSFESDESAQYDVEEALYSVAGEIAAWRCCEHKIEPDQRLILRVKMIDSPDEALDEDYAETLPGPAFYQTEDDIGFTRSTRMNMVLDPVQGLHDEFKLITAYPDTDLSIAPKINADLTDMLVKTDEYKRASPIQKAFWEYKAELKPEDRPRVFMPQNRKLISIDCPPVNGQPASFSIWDNGDIKYRVRQPDGKFAHTKVTDQNREQFQAEIPAQTALAVKFSERISALQNDERQAEQKSHQLGTKGAPAKSQPKKPDPRPRTVDDLPDITPGPNSGPDYEPD